jgi:alkylhydroperoxidase family enzyme
MASRVKSVEDGRVSAQVKEYIRSAEKRGAPNSTLLRILARDPDSLRIFSEAWNLSFYRGRVEHLLKEIVRVRMAELRGCHY